MDSIESRQNLERFRELVLENPRLHDLLRSTPDHEAFVAHAFDRFSRADLARGRGGVGLGLTIVRTIAQAHGGDAGACDLPQGGADVWIAIPVAERAVGATRPPLTV